MTGTELLPCPFCRSTDIKLYGNDWFVACENCDAQGPKALNPADSAISFWNTRNTAASGAGTAASTGRSTEGVEGSQSLIEKLAARADRADMWTGETPVIWLKEAEYVIRQHQGELFLGYCAHNGLCVRDRAAPSALTEAERREAVEAMTARIIKEAFALEGIPIKAIFAENLLGQAALAALLEKYELRRRR
ncbi:Lar family restriction alleviation protein [Fimbriiglobus ruber]|nr:Lar family restriction alleviation protein [Fimbriiglobus ruber]